MASRFGKLVKKSDEKTMNMLDMDSYPWLHFNEQSIIFPDNVKRTVILEKMHDPLEISQKVIVAKEFEKQLAAKSKPLFPKDMTEDYKKGQREAIKRRRRTLLDEEEAMALELAELEHLEDVKIAKSTSKDKKNQSFEKFEAKGPEAGNQNVTEKSSAQQEKSMSDHIKVVTQEKTPELGQQQVAQGLNSQINESKVTEEVEKAKDEGYQLGYKEGYAGGEKQGKEEGYQVGIEEGKKVGYQNGEERGLIAAESKFDRAFANISEAAIKMEALKNSLLAEGKDIFVEILKLCSEKILREQLKSDDSTLYKLFDDVLKMFEANSALNIQMNSTDAQRLKKHLATHNQTERIKIKENNNLDSGDFQVENESGASLVDIKKNVDIIIDKLKSELFKELDHDSSENIEPKKAS